MPGAQASGLRHAREAEQRGAAAVVWDGPDDAAPAAADEPGVPYVPGVPYIHVPRLRARLGAIAARFYDNPSADMLVVAVTGTNGKTTVAHTIAQALKMRRGDCGLFGTLGAGTVDCLAPSSNTTPDALAVQRGLAALRGQGVDCAVMEASSHGLEQFRLAGTAVDIAVLTQLGRDHLDYHRTPEAYAASKKKLFEKNSVRTAVLNLDDAFGVELKTFCTVRKIKVLGYSLHGRGADVVGTVRAAARNGTDLDIAYGGQTARVKSRLAGAFNAANVLAAFAVLVAGECDAETAAALLSATAPVPGRMQLFAAAGRPLVVLDYAHTPDALEHVLSSNRAMCAGCMVCVFGCGGERDRGKRPLMGEIAGRLCDEIILTDDNPRRESPRDIVADIAAGVRSSGREDAETVHDRARAIVYAIGRAGPNDCVLVLGKGHERTQDFGDRVVAFSDSEVIRSALADVDGGGATEPGAA